MSIVILENSMVIFKIFSVSSKNRIEICDILITNGDLSGARRDVWRTNMKVRRDAGGPVKAGRRDFSEVTWQTSGKSGEMSDGR